MRNLFIFLITFFYFLPVVAETALKCDLYKMCTPIGNLGCKTFDDKKNNLIVILNENNKLIKINNSVNEDETFNGTYYVTKDDNFKYVGLNISGISKEDAKAINDLQEKVRNKEMTEELYHDIVNHGYFNGFTKKLYLHKYSLELKLEVIRHYTQKDESMLKDYYFCVKTKKKL